MKVGTVPQIQGEQGSDTGAHRMRLIACMMNHSSWRTRPPAAVTLLPGGGTGQRNVDFLRFVPMSGVVGFGSKEQEAAGDPFAREWPSEADNLTPPIIFQECRADLGRRVGLP